MTGPLLLAAVLAIDPRSARVDVSGGVAAELRGGVAPRTQLDDPEPSVLSIVTPNIDFEIRGRRAGQFSLGYAPRMQYRAPNRLSVERPIFLHQLYAAYAIDFSRRWSSQLTAGASVGELDYTGVVFAFGGEQAGTFDVDVAQFAIASGQLDVEGRVAPNHSILISPRYELRTPIGSTADAADQGLSALPTQMTGNLGLGYQFQASPVDAVEATVTPGIVDYNDEVTFFSAEGRIGWERQIRPELRSHADLGIFGAQTLRSTGMAPVAADELKIFPVGSARLTGRLYGRSTHRLEGNVGVGVLGFFDRIAERVEPRGNVTAGLTTIIPPRWSAGVSATAFTALTADPRPPQGMTMFRVPETVFAGTTPVTYNINDHAQFEFGTVVSVRGSHLDDPNFELSQLEAWLYIAFRIGGGTARGGDEVGAREDGPIGVGAQGFNAATGGRR